MKVFFIILLAGLLLPFVALSQYVTVDNYTGFFNDVNSWVSGNMPNTSGVNDDTEINGNITCNSNLTISGDVDLTINDTLIISGDLLLQNKASLTIANGAICIVYGNVTATNKLNLDFGSHFVVTGDFTASENQTDVIFNEGAAIYILGNVNAGDLQGFNCDNSSNYVPPGTDEECRYGDIISLEDNENNESGIYDFFVINDSLKGIEPTYTELCGTSDVTISVFFSDGTNYTWYDSLGTTIVGYGTSYTASTAGEYFATFDYNSETIVTYRAKVVVPNINADVNFTDPSCPGNSDGTILISNPTGGSGNYEYSVNGGTSWHTSGNFIGLVEGFYDLSIRDLISLCETTLATNLELAGIDTVIPNITCPSDINITTDIGGCEATGIVLGSPVTSDNCGIASLINDASEPYLIGTTVVTWTVTDNSGNVATCEQNVMVEPDEIIDIEVADLGDGCQSGETGSTTTLIWDITKLSGSDSWTYSYTITDGISEVASGSDIAVSTNTIQVVYDMPNETAVSKTYTLTVTNVTDSCGSSETNIGNNSDIATFHGLPETSEITSN